jgi:hypothetical protein
MELFSYILSHELKILKNLQINYIITLGDLRLPMENRRLAIDRWSPDISK